MKKKHFIYIVVFLLLLISVFRACGKHHKKGSQLSGAAFYIPAEATAILLLNTPSILQKLDYNALKESDSYKEKLLPYYSENPPFSKVFANIQNAGIADDQPAAFYLYNGNKSEEVYTASIFAIKDDAAFNAMVISTKITVKEREGWKEGIIDPVSSVFWNKELAFFISTSEGTNKEDLGNNLLSDQTVKYYDVRSDFKSFTEEIVGDLAFWVDGDSYITNQLHATGPEGELDDWLLKGNILSGEGVFEDGSIDLSVNLGFNTLIKASIAEIFNEKTSSEDYIIPNQELGFALNGMVDLDGLFGRLLSTQELKLQARNELAAYGLMVEDFGKALNGELSLATFVNEEGYNSTLFSLKIKDHSHFDRLIEVMEGVGKIETEGTNQYRMSASYVPFMPFKVTYADGLQRMLIKDSRMYVSLDSILIEKLKNDDVSPMPSYARKESYVQMYGTNSFEKVKEYADQMSVETYNINFNKDKINLSFKLKDKDKSALKQLLQL